MLSLEAGYKSATSSNQHRPKRDQAGEQSLQKLAQVQVTKSKEVDRGNKGYSGMYSENAQKEIWQITKHYRAGMYGVMGVMYAGRRGSGSH